MKPNATKRTLASAVSAVLGAHQFKSDRLVWYRNENGVLVLLELQKSPYGFNAYSLNVGVHVRALARPDDLTKNGVPMPAFGPWQLYLSTVENKLSRPEVVKRALDLDDPTFDEAERVLVIKDAISEALPLLERLRTKEGIRNLLQEEPRAGLETKAFHEWVLE